MVFFYITLIFFYKFNNNYRNLILIFISFFCHLYLFKIILKPLQFQRFLLYAYI